MTSTPVMGFGNVQTVDYPGLTQNTGKVQTSEFKNFLADSQSENAVPDKKVKAGNLTAEKAESKDEVTKKNEAKPVTEISKESKADRTVTDEETEAVADAVKEVTDILEEKFDVTLEDIEAALENLGLSLIAVLDASKLPEIVATLTGNDDVLALATDENLYVSLTEVTKEVDTVVNNLSEELNIPVDELSEAVSEFEVSEDISALQSPTEELTADETDGEEETAPKSFEEKISITGNNRENVRVERPVTQESRATAEEAVKRPEILKETKKDLGRNENAPMSFAENLIAKTREALSETENTVSYTSFETENIMNQITEGIDVNFSADVSEISLRLHPASLGNVVVKITQNNEGLLTARFTAQNEAVKAVIESQATALRETLESKGVTVEAVEVTVQSHQFERNLSEQNRGQRDAETPRKKGIRRINLGDDEAVSLDEDDRVLKEVMAQNGNTVDYSA